MTEFRFKTETIAAEPLVFFSSFANGPETILIHETSTTSELQQGSTVNIQINGQYFSVIVLQKKNIGNRVLEIQVSQIVSLTQY